MGQRIAHRYLASVRFDVPSEDGHRPSANVENPQLT
jgi:hypothetical protein